MMISDYILWKGHLFHKSGIISVKFSIRNHHWKANEELYPFLQLCKCTLLLLEQKTKQYMYFFPVYNILWKFPQV